MGNDLVSIGSELYARQVRGEHIDALERLAYFRLLFLRQRRAGHELRLTEYGWLLQLAMKPARLPKYRAPVEVEADRDAAIAIHYHNAAMQHFCKALGIAA